ncbi:uncharacterized protein LOC125318422 isoform X1 [Corvus hawaiiensis]|uniref:uncharacterized protein LOC125318422 isoform X1 n=1 Tax=Corvus hawaiiensis TaxID=134902 RepID=UPI0020192B45|nr:uncharacterized protein LOC125318422 isoform X1 [Corvus hawaiiensis]
MAAAAGAGAGTEEGGAEAVAEMELAGAGGPEGTAPGHADGAGILNCAQEALSQAQSTEQCRAELQEQMGQWNKPEEEQQEQKQKLLQWGRRMRMEPAKRAEGTEHSKASAPCCYLAPASGEPHKFLATPRLFLPFSQLPVSQSGLEARDSSYSCSSMPKAPSSPWRHPAFPLSQPPHPCSCQYFCSREQDGARGTFRLSYSQSQAGHTPGRAKTVEQALRAEGQYQEAQRQLEHLEQLKMEDKKGRGVNRAGGGRLTPGWKGVGSAGSATFGVWRQQPAGSELCCPGWKMQGDLLSWGKKAGVSLVLAAEGGVLCSLGTIEVGVSAALEDGGGGLHSTEAESVAWDDVAGGVPFCPVSGKLIHKHQRFTSKKETEESCNFIQTKGEAKGHFPCGLSNCWRTQPPFYPHLPAAFPSLFPHWLRYLRGTDSRIA